MLGRCILAALITLFAMGALSFMNVPGLQLYVVQPAEKELPGTADIASTFNIASFNIGIVIGAYAGGLIVASPLGLGATPWSGALLVTRAIVITIGSARLAKEPAR